MKVMSTILFILALIAAAAAFLAAETWVIAKTLFWAVSGLSLDAAMIAGALIALASATWFVGLVRIFTVEMPNAESGDSGEEPVIVIPGSLAKRLKKRR